MQAMGFQAFLHLPDLRPFAIAAGPDGGRGKGGESGDLPVLLQLLSSIVNH